MGKCHTFKCAWLRRKKIYLVTESPSRQKSGPDNRRPCSNIRWGLSPPPPPKTEEANWPPIETVTSTPFIWTLAPRIPDSGRNGDVGFKPPPHSVPIPAGESVGPPSQDTGVSGFWTKPLLPGAWEAGYPGFDFRKGTVRHSTRGVGVRVRVGVRDHRRPSRKQESPAFNGVPSSSWPKEPGGEAQPPLPM